MDHHCGEWGRVAWRAWHENKDLAGHGVAALRPYRGGLHSGNDRLVRLARNAKFDSLPLRKRLDFRGLPTGTQSLDLSGAARFEIVAGRAPGRWHVEQAQGPTDGWQLRVIHLPARALGITHVCNRTLNSLQQMGNFFCR